MGQSQDPDARARQLANLQKGRARPGEQRGLIHGAYALVAGEELDARTEELCERLGRSVPVQDSSDWLMVRMLAENRVLRDRCASDILRRGIENAKSGDLRATVKLAMELDKAAIKMCQELGLSARARVAIGVQLAQASESYVMKMARAAAEAREAHASQNGGGDA